MLPRKGKPSFELKRKQKKRLKEEIEQQTKEMETRGRRIIVRLTHGPAAAYSKHYVVQPHLEALK